MAAQTNNKRKGAELTHTAQMNEVIMTVTMMAFQPESEPGVGTRPNMLLIAFEFQVQRLTAG